MDRALIGGPGDRRRSGIVPGAPRQCSGRASRSPSPLRQGEPSQLWIVLGEVREFRLRVSALVHPMEPELGSASHLVRCLHPTFA
jgi:hypothetical protein